MTVLRWVFEFSSNRTEHRPKLYTTQLPGKLARECVWDTLQSVVQCHGFSNLCPARNAVRAVRVSGVARKYLHTSYFLYRYPARMIPGTIFLRKHTRRTRHTNSSSLSTLEPRTLSRCQLSSSRFIARFRAANATLVLNKRFIRAPERNLKKNLANNLRLSRRL